VREEIAKAHILECFAIAYLVCFIMMIVAALNQFIRHQWQPAIRIVLFIAGTIIFWILCLPMLAEAK
jgi:glycopeptide antibiotics resistance protein